MSVDQVVELTPAEMHAYRAAALDAAARTHAGQSVPEVLHAAGSYLMFMLQGEPIWVIGQTIRETKGEPPSPSTSIATSAATASPASPSVTAPSLPGEKIHKDEPVVKAAKAAAKKAAATVAATASPAPVAATVVAPSVAPAVTAEIAPPTTVKEVGVELVKLVQDQSRGGFNAAKALLAEYGVDQLAKIPGAKLAEFMARVKAVGLTAAPADPTGLLG